MSSSPKFSIRDHQTLLCVVALLMQVVVGGKFRKHEIYRVSSRCELKYVQEHVCKVWFQDHPVIDKTWGWRRWQKRMHQKDINIFSPFKSFRKCRASAEKWQVVIHV